MTLFKTAIALSVCAGAAVAQDYQVYSEYSSYTVSSGVQQSVTVKIFAEESSAMDLIVSGFFLDVVGDDSQGVSITNVTVNSNFSGFSTGGTISGDDAYTWDGGQFYFPPFVPANTTDNPAELFSVTYLIDTDFDGSATFQIQRSQEIGEDTYGVTWQDENTGTSFYGDYGIDNPTFGQYGVAVQYGSFTIETGTIPAPASLGSVALGAALFARRRR